MKRSFVFISLLFSMAVNGQQLSKNKTAVTRYIDQHQQSLIGWSNQIWEYAETSFHEIKSSALLTGILQDEGFTVEKNLCGLPTVFMASYGSGKPVIGLYGEYDADPNASNKVVPRKEERSPQGNGHGGNHNLLGVGSLGAALAIKDLIKQGKLNGTIRYYGSTSEGVMGTRAYLARDGYFNDLDFSLYWHPSPGTWIPTDTWDALIEFDVSLTAKRWDVFNDSVRDVNTNDLFINCRITAMKESFFKQIAERCINFVE